MSRVLQGALQALCQKGQLDKALEALSRMETPPSATIYVSLLKECKKIKALPQAKQVHAHLAHHSTPLTGLLGDQLVMTLAFCGAIENALHTCYTLTCRTVFPWTAIISACVDHSRSQEALKMYQCMLDDGVQPDRYTFVSLFKACGNIPDLELGRKLHADASRKGIVSDVFVGNTLVSMYGKCGDIVEAECVFCAMLQRTVVSWNSMFSAYVEHCQGEKALQLYLQMQEERVISDLATSVIALQACAILAEKDLLVDGRQTMLLPLEIGQALHAGVRRKGFASHIFVASTLVSMYGKCRAIVEAQHVFATLSHHDVVSWNVMLSAYVEQGQGQKALQLYTQMQKDGTSPDKMSFMIALQACAALAEKEEALLVKGEFIKLMPLEIGQALHTDAQFTGFASDTFVGNTLVSMYGKCGATVEAEQVFGALSHHDVVSWNAMLSAYVEQGQGGKALNLYLQMQEEGLSPDQLTSIIAIQACATLAQTEEALLEEGRSTKVMPLEIGQALHVDTRRKGFSSDVIVGSTLVSMYGKCGAIVEAEHVFNALFHRDVVSWNAMLSAYIEQGKGHMVLQLYTHMQEKGVSPDQLTFVTAIQACATLAEMEVFMEGKSTKATSLEIGKALHADACRKGFLSHVFVSNTLVSMYGKCGATVEAEHVFGALFPRTVVSWNAILSAYVEQGQGERALYLYKHMQEDGVSSDQLTCVIALQACASLAEKESAVFVEGRSTKLMALEIGHALHADARRQGFTFDVIVGNTLVSMFGKCGAIVEAKNVFDALSQRTVVSWNAMVSAYIEQGQGEEALQLYREMRKQGVTLDHITPICILQACSIIGSLEICVQIHFDIVSAGYDFFSSLAAPLIHAYGSCASMVDAQEFFEKLLEPDIMSWNACIAGYAGEGNYVASLHMFEELKLAGIKPDEVTFTSVLSACSHTGLVFKGLEYFESISRDYGLAPDLKHYGSMLDLLGRAGDFNRVENVLEKMPIEADVTIWLCLLGACCTHGNLELAKQAFDHAVNLQPKQGTSYVLMSNIYVNVGPLKCADKVEISRQQHGWCMEAGWSELCAGICYG